MAGICASSDAAKNAERKTPTFLLTATPQTRPISKTHNYHAKSHSRPTILTPSTITRSTDQNKHLSTYPN